MKNELIPQNLYVIEQANIDDIVIWQNQLGLGEIFESISNANPIKIANSLLEYISMYDYVNLEIIYII